LVQHKIVERKTNFHDYTPVFTRGNYIFTQQ